MWLRGDPTAAGITCKGTWELNLTCRVNILFKKLLHQSEYIRMWLEGDGVKINMISVVPRAMLRLPGDVLVLYSVTRHSAVICLVAHIPEFSTRQCWVQLYSGETPKLFLLTVGKYYCEHFTTGPGRTRRRMTSPLTSSGGRVRSPRLRCHSVAERRG